VRSKDEIMQEYIGLRLLQNGLEKLSSVRDASVDEKVSAIIDVIEDD
jgi:hypothetical protein